MTRGVEAHPLPAAQVDPLEVANPLGRRGRPHPGQGQRSVGPQLSHALRRRPQARTSPRRLARVVEEMEERGEFRIHVGIGILQLAVVDVTQVEEGAEALVGHDLGAGLLGEHRGRTEVVRVRVGYQHGVHPGQGYLGQRQTTEQELPVGGPGHPGVDESEAPLVLEGVAVDVSEPCELDGKLQPQDSRRHLGDLLGCLFLLLALDHEREPNLTHRSSDRVGESGAATGRARPEPITGPGSPSQRSRTDRGDRTFRVRRDPTPPDHRSGPGRRGPPPRTAPDLRQPDR